MKISFIDLFYHKVLQFSREVINFLTKKQQPAAGCHKDRMPLVGKSKLEYMVLWCGELLSVCPLCSASYHPQRGCSMKSAVKKPPQGQHQRFSFGALNIQKSVSAITLRRRRIAMQSRFAPSSHTATVWVSSHTNTPGFLYRLSAPFCALPL